MRIQSCEGNKWMLLGSKEAKVLNSHDFAIGTSVALSRKRTYQVQPDGSVRRLNADGTRISRKRKKSLRKGVA